MNGNSTCCHFLALNRSRWTPTPVSQPFPTPQGLIRGEGLIFSHVSSACFGWFYHRLHFVFNAGSYHDNLASQRQGYPKLHSNFLYAAWGRYFFLPYIYTIQLRCWHRVLKFVLRTIFFPSHVSYTIAFLLIYTIQHQCLYYYVTFWIISVQCILCN